MKINYIYLFRFLEHQRVRDRREINVVSINFVFCSFTFSFSLNSLTFRLILPLKYLIII